MPTIPSPPAHDFSTRICERELFIPAEPQLVSGHIMNQHPTAAPADPYIGPVRPAIMDLDYKRRDPKLKSKQPLPVARTPHHSPVEECVAVGSSHDTGTIELYTKSAMLEWSFKRLGNRRSRLMKLQNKAMRAHRRHQVEMISEQLALIEEVQEINKFGRYAEQRSQSRAASQEAKDRGTEPPLRRPRVAGKSSVADKKTVSGRSSCVPVVPPRKSLSKNLPLLPPKKLSIFRKESSDSSDWFAEKSPVFGGSRSNVINNSKNENKCVKKPVFDNLSNVKSKSRVTLSKAKAKTVSRKNLKQKPVLEISDSDISMFQKSVNLCDQSIIRNKRVFIPKNFNFIKAKPVTRSGLPCLFDSRAESIQSLNTAQQMPVLEDSRDFCSDESPNFSEGSPNDPKLYLGGKFSDQSTSDSPETQAWINNRALWFEPCTRREYVYKMRAWRAEGRKGRPTNSPLNFEIPKSHKTECSKQIFTNDSD